MVNRNVVFRLRGKSYVDGGIISEDGGYAVVRKVMDINGGDVIALKTYNDRELQLPIHNSFRTHKLLNPDSRRFPKILGRDRRSYAMDFIEGSNLSDLGFGQSEDIVLVIGYQAALCLDEFHKTRPEAPLVHRDIKPDNFIVRSDGTLVLIDFDTVYIDWLSLSGREQIVGTPSFTCPEQFSGHQVLPVSDIFSLGVTLYRIFTNKPFWLGWTYLGMDVEPKIVDAINNLPKGLAREIIGTCCRYGKMYESAEHMTSELSDRLRRNGMDPEKSHEVLAELVA